MEYTDKELKEATQIAYLGFIEKSEINLRADGKKGPFTIKELIKDVELDDFDKKIMENLTEEMLNWKIVDINDTINQNGFYGCVIETSPENAIVAFRGSEGFDTYSGLVYDWAQSDFGLLNSKETPQQAETERYADELVKRKVLDKYKSIAVTGHSLGGNLASHFAVVNAYEGTRNSTFEKINQVVNFDGPGVSEEYLKYNEKAIQKQYLR